jgi:acyl-homoserine lactone acylase PvdQ
MEELEKQTNPELSTSDAQNTPEISAPPADQEKKDREYNFRVMRQRAESAERRAQELEQAMRPQQQTNEDDIGVEDDGIVEGKHLRKYSSSVKEMKKELEQTKKQLEALNNVSSESYLRAKFPDFEQVVTDENLEKLSRAEPALYRSILSNPDLKDKGETARKAIIAFVQPGKFDQQEKKLENNMNKPRSASTVAPQASDSPLSRVGDYDRRVYTESQKKEMYKEMIAAKARMV